MKAKTTVTWIKPRGEVGTDGFGMLTEAVANVVGTLLLIFASISMLFRLSDFLELESRHAFAIIFFDVLVFGIFEIGLQLGIRRMGEKGEKLEKTMRIAATAFFLILIIAFFLRRREELAGGFAELANRFFSLFNSSYNTSFWVSGEDELWQSLALCFGVQILFFVCYALSVSKTRRWFFLIFPTTGVILIMLVGIPPTWSQITETLIGTYLISRGRIRRKEFKSTMILLALLGIVLFLAGRLMDGQAQRFLGLAKQAKRYERKIEKKVSTLYSSLTDPMRKNVTNDSPNFKNYKMMTVKLGEKPAGNLYFKTYAAVNYGRGNWSSSASSFQKACEENGVNPEAAMKILNGALFKRLSGDSIPYQLKYEGRLGNEMPLPYAADTTKIGGVGYKGDLFARKSLFKEKAKFQGWRTNAFDVNDLWMAAENSEDQTPEEEIFWDWYGEYVLETCLEVPDYVWSLGAYQELNRRSATIGRQVDVVNLDGRSYVVVKGLSPEEDVNQWRISVAELVSNYMTSNYSYSWNLDEIGDDEDPIEYFLEKGKRGYCVHFASAGVLLLRALDVPARYATGYVVKPEAFEKGDDGMNSAKVIDRNGHAWAEIYLDGLGWIPIEMTAGYESGSAEDPTSEEAQKRREVEDLFSPGQNQEREEQEPKASVTPRPANTPTPSQNPKGNNKGGKSKKNGGKGQSGAGEGSGETNGALFWVIVGAAVLAIIGILLILWRRAYVRRLQDAIRKRRYKAAVLIMNRRIYKRLRKKRGIKGNHPTDGDYEKALLGFMGEAWGEAVSEFVWIVKEAKFSDHFITREQCKAVRRFYHNFLLI